MLNNLCEAEALALFARYDFLDLCLLGETGTGKTRAAEQIHRLSPRSEKPFIAVNCAELSRSLIEAELFGYEKGAFTGAVAAKAGKFEAASGGTLFLDEIGELDSEMQAKLLKVVEEKRITRVGSVVPRDVDVRIIYATHRELKVFREDLRYRVAAHTIHLKPLRERTEQILPLARLFIANFSRKSGRSVAASENALRLLKRAEWRGNVRELRSFIEKACLDALFVADWQKPPKGFAPNVELTPELLLSRLRQTDAHTETVLPSRENTDASDFVAADYRQEIKDFDCRLVRKTLEKNSRNVSRTAVELGLSRYGLIKKIKRYGITFATE
ncbi:MAG: sigma 54-interacting transcriptional regulator [Acidobacteriota bacterium]|nr:sigma 54-interacting transcriptional regulator [Acidobacteriota bacterium]